MIQITNGLTRIEVRPSELASYLKIGWKKVYNKPIVSNRSTARNDANANKETYSRPKRKKSK